jgi:hypothetical protein
MGGVLAETAAEGKARILRRTFKRQEQCREIADLASLF